MEEAGKDEEASFSRLLSEWRLYSDWRQLNAPRPVRISTVFRLDPAYSATACPNLASIRTGSTLGGPDLSESSLYSDWIQLWRPRPVRILPVFSKAPVLDTLSLKNKKGSPHRLSY